MATKVDRTCKTCGVDRGQLSDIRDSRGTSRLLCVVCAETFNKKFDERQYNYFPAEDNRQPTPRVDLRQLYYGLSDNLGGLREIAHAIRDQDPVFGNLVGRINAAFDDFNAHIERKYRWD